MKPLLLLGMGALKNFRELRTALFAGAAILFLLTGLAIWAAMVAFGWLSNQVPATREMLSSQAQAAKNVLNEKVPELRRQMESLASGTTQGVKEWLHGENPTLREVPGEDPGAVARYEGLVRIQYSAQDNSRTAVFEGAADFGQVAAHYHARFMEKGLPHRVLFATAGEEKHEYRSKDKRLELRIKNLGSTIQVKIAEFPSEQQVAPPGGKPVHSERGT